MARALSLHPLTALDAPPIALIGHAAALAVPLVCLFTHVPPAIAGKYPQVSRADVASVGAALADAGVGLCNLEVFPLDRDGALDHLEEGLAIGAALGASKATAHIHEIDGPQQAIDRFAAFADLAARHGIVAGLEFNNFSAIRDIWAAEAVVRGGGRGALVLDALHLVRGGGVPEDVALAADLIGYAQLSDGPPAIAEEDRWREAVVERALPGDGSFPLAAMLAPLAPDVVVEVEVPQGAARKAGVPALERCRRAVEAARRVMADARAEAAA